MSPPIATHCSMNTLYRARVRFYFEPARPHQG